MLFSARCRLYRFHKGTDNKERDGEVKERGTGDMKLLKNRETGKVRCVMRREQVLKVCANFAIHSGFTVNNTKRGENVLTWSCKASLSFLSNLSASLLDSRTFPIQTPQKASS